MAKVTGPLLSFSAKGTIASTATFSSWKGIKYAKQYTIPANPNTNAQQGVRGTFGFLNLFWRIAPTDARAPWDANAVGQQYTGRNKLISDNLPALYQQTDAEMFIASPGSRGGAPLAGLTPTTGTGGGEIDVLATAPTIPNGWSLEAVVFMAFPDQNPNQPFVGPIAIEVTEDSPYDITLDGLPDGVPCIVTAWPVWERPDGTTAYGPSLTHTATSGTT